ncbi:MAG: EVE domain-containing protein [Methylacidiphilales bacterium]|nr:EVE domain-containing protein [Candidatus Methylacidiphilales bacterium]
MKHWLVKTEPEAYSFAQLQKDKTTAWTGIRNYAARLNLRAMAKDDEVFVYHSVTEKAVVGTATIARTAYPDPTVEPDEKGEWACVDLKAGKAFPRPVSLEAIKAHRTLKNLLLVRQSRLSVVPIGEKDAVELRKLGGL